MAGQVSSLQPWPAPLEGRSNHLPRVRQQTVKELRATCRSKNLAVTGKKADLIERLRGYNVADGDDSCEDGWEGR